MRHWNLDPDSLLKRDSAEALRFLFLHFFRRTQTKIFPSRLWQIRAHINLVCKTLIDLPFLFLIVFLSSCCELLSIVFKVVACVNVNVLPTCINFRVSVFCPWLLNHMMIKTWVILHKMLDLACVFTFIPAGDG